MMTISRSKKRYGFTLVELMIVVTIILLLAGLTAPVVMSIMRGRKVRDAADLVQATLVGARDRAMQARAPIGVRLVRSDTNPDLVEQLVLIRAAENFSAGTVHVVRSDAPNSALPGLPDAQLNADPGSTPFLPVDLVIGSGGVNWSRFSTGGVIRFEDAGPIFQFQYIDGQHLRLLGITPSSPMFYSDTAAPPASPSAFDAYLRDPTHPGINYKIWQYAVPLEGAEPVLMPASVAIDLGQVSVPPIPAADQQLSRVMSSVSGWDILFMPNGELLPPQAALPKVGLWVRNITEDTRPDALGRKSIASTSSLAQHSIVSIQSRTGTIATSAPVFEDTNNDGLFDFDAYYNNVSRNDAGL